MPTRHPRRSFTETPRVERVLRRLRAHQPGQRIDYQELVILGAGEQLRRLERRESTPALVERWLSRRHGEGIDADAALSVHESGWKHEA